MKMRFFQMSRGFLSLGLMTEVVDLQEPSCSIPALERPFRWNQTMCGREVDKQQEPVHAVFSFQFNSLWGDNTRTGKHSCIVCAGSSKVAAKSSEGQVAVGKLGSYIMTNSPLKLPSLHYVELWLNAVTLQGPVLFYFLLLCQTGAFMHTRIALFPSCFWKPGSPWWRSFTYLGPSGCVVYTEQEKAELTMD